MFRSVNRLCDHPKVELDKGMIMESQRDGRSEGPSYRKLHIQQDLESMVFQSDTVSDLNGEVDSIMPGFRIDWSA